MTTIHTLLLSFGRVEGARFCFVPFKHNEGFPSIRDAVVDLIATARAILGERKRDTATRKLSPCCRVTLSAIPTAARCATCGRKVVKAQELVVTLEDVSTYLESFTTRVQDGSLDDCEAFELRGWEPGGMDGTCVVVDHVDGLLDEGYRHFHGDTLTFAIAYEDAPGALDAESIRGCFRAGVLPAGNTPP